MPYVFPLGALQFSDLLDLMCAKKRYGYGLHALQTLIWPIREGLVESEECGVLRKKWKMRSAEYCAR